MLEESHTLLRYHPPICHLFPSLPSLLLFDSAEAVEFLNPWVIVDALRTVWQRNDISPRSHYELDRLVCSLRANSVFHPHLFYPDGFGNARRAAVATSACQAIIIGVRSDDAGIRAAAAPARISVKLTSSSFGSPDAHVAEGSFAAPAAMTLPSVAGEARFQLITPLDTAKRAATGFAVAVLLPGTGEQGFSRRRNLVAYPLAKRGIASVILEGPFYGTRRPASMHGSKLRELSDLPVLGYGTIDEARSIVGWLRSRDAGSATCLVTALPRASYPFAELFEEGGGSEATEKAHKAVVLTGTSMGGLHAAMAASMMPQEWGDNIGVAAWLCPTSGVGVFLAGALAASVDWQALARDAQPDAPSARALAGALGSIDATIAATALSRLPDTVIVDQLARLVPGVPRPALARAMTAAARLLRCTDITNFPPPMRSDAVVFVAAEHDAYVPLDDDARRMWTQLEKAWPGASVKIMPCGHVSGAMFNTDAYVDVVCDVARRARAVPEAYNRDA